MALFHFKYLRIAIAAILLIIIWATFLSGMCYLWILNPNHPFVNLGIGLISLLSFVKLAGIIAKKE